MTKTAIPSKRLRVLLVDDSPRRRASVERSLLEVGCEVVGFASGHDDLLQRVRTTDPDVVIIELESPGRDTLESLESVRSSAPRPIVMFTQDDAGKTISRATRAGVSAYVVDGINNKRVRPILDDAANRKALYERFLHSQQFAQIDPWKARAEGAEANEFTPLKIA